MPDASPASLLPAREIAQERALLAAAAREAGALASSMQKSGVKNWSKDGGSPVTEADLAVNDLLEKRLRTSRPDYAWLSEESADTQGRKTASRTFIVDPIDGTADFLAGRAEWCVALALLHGADLIAAALFNPVTDELFDAGLGLGATRNGAPLAVSRRSQLDDCLILSNKIFHRPEWTPPWPQMRVRSGGSCGCRMADIASGRADAYLSLSPKWDWDAAPGALLITEAGGLVSDAYGAPFVFNLDVPRQPSVAAAPQALHDLILTRTRSIRLPITKKA